jgi:cellobiose phosphorylase
LNYGYFDDKNKEYVITNPKTPVKWINYIGTLKFGGFIDQTGGALLCKGDPALNRITKYIPQLPNADFKGESLYIRFKENNTYKIFSPFFTPTLDKYDLYECHVGLQYSKYITEFYGIRSEITIFVPVGGQCEIRDITVINKSGKTLDIDLIPVVEYSHFDALKQFTNADWVPQTMQSRIYNDKNGMKILTQYAFLNKDLFTNYFTSNYPVSSFESDRRKFLGENEYSTWQKPLSLLNEELSNYEANRGDNVGALMHHLGLMKNGESKRIIVQLGQIETIKKDYNYIEKYRNEKEVQKAFEEIKVFWDDYLSKQVVNTPSESLNTMINIHNARQCYITKNWSRDLSLYQLGFGGRGIGFRDSSQDVLGIMHAKPEEARELIEKLLQVQRRDGSAMHQFYASTMEATEGDSREYHDRPKYYGDDHLWIILAVSAYLKETGDIDFLKRELPFYDKDHHSKQPLESGTVLEHLKRAIEFTHRNKGQHDLPLLGFADWNDTVNLKKGAESLFIANQYGYALKEMMDILEFVNDKQTAEKYKMYYDEMKTAVNKHAWDGEWYVRYFDYDGTPLGSKSNTHGKIYINSQSWAVISGFAPDDKALKCLESLNKYLNTSKGMKLSYPGFNGYDKDKGGITTYPPGAKENGGIFLHTNPWVMIAETIVGNGDRAFQYYIQINPASKNEIIDEYEIEPYCYAQNILGDEHPQFGLARNSWLSGTSSWTYQAATKYILGIQPMLNGLKIDPCIPKDWKGFSVTRVFRGAKYEITVENPNRVSKGVVKVLVDDKEIQGNIVPVFNDRKTHTVKVTMG